MGGIGSVLRLVRSPNLAMMALTMVLLRYCVITPVVWPDGAAGGVDFWLLVLVTVLLAAGGYIINDYFDVGIDRVNNPARQVVDRSIDRRTAILMHIVLNSIAILIGLYLGWRVRSFAFGMIFPFISGLLWLYSARYKRTFVLGNLLVAALSAFVILVTWLQAFLILRLDPELFASALPGIRLVHRVILGYTVFAFLLSVAREIIKDMEDAQGDALAGCRTLPIVAGMRGAAFTAGAVVVLTILLLAYVQLMQFRYGFMAEFWYFMAVVQPGAVLLLVLLFRARNPREFRRASYVCKAVMLAGTLSMVLFYLITERL